MVGLPAFLYVYSVTNLPRVTESSHCYTIPSGERAETKDLMNRYKTVDAYLDGHSAWRDVLSPIRQIINGTGLVETVKWGAPCYTFNRKNIIGLGAFQDFVSIWFFQGVLLKDKEKKLINAQEGQTKALRQWRIKDVDDIDAPLLRAYIDEAIENQRHGHEIKPERGKPLVVPDVMAVELKKRKAQSAFDTLSLGKQREYASYITAAKRDETKQKRLDKIIPMILEGHGLNDSYRS